jgi:2-dehydro-3-deoxyphosphogluconate aldolase/(4S)-4-hydroxy-2-oxoglutarate aldolase
LFPKLQILQKIVDGGLVVVIRTENREQAVRVANACVDGGVEVLEITFTVPGAIHAIEKLVDEFKGRVVVGAGTVLDAETARAAILAGARFIVSPSFDAGAARVCHRYQIPYLPGAATPNEIVNAMEGGADIVKVFPGESLGPAFVKAILAALPHAPLMPTGGVTVDNAAEWIQAGCVALGVGGSVTAGAKTGDYSAVTNLARQFLERIRQARR